MSDTSNPRETIDLQAVVARIDRDLMESRKLREEADKLSAERRKLDAEERKLQRDRFLAPWALAAAFVGAVLASAVVSTVIGSLMR